MRILVVSTAFPRDADDPTVKWLAEAIRRLRARGYAIEVFTSAYKGGGNTTLDGIPIHRFRYFFRRWENLTHEESAPDRMRRSLFYAMLPGFYLLFGSIAMWRLQRRERYDIVHVHWPLPHAVFGWVARAARRRTRLIMQFYSIELRWVNERIAILRGFLRRAIRTADRVIAISTATAREVSALAGDDVPIEVIPYAVEMPSRKASRHDEATILYVGRLVERKGVAYLIDASASLPKARIVIIGDGPEREALENRAKERGVTDRVEFRGWVTPGDLDRAYSSATVFALPAVVDKRGDTEGLGMVLLEAMSYYVPVVTTALGGITDIVENDQTGLIVPPNDSEALAAALRRLIDDRALAARLGTAGERMIEERFSWPHIIDQFAAVYDSLDPDPRTTRAGSTDR
ncbi:MAG TPA: glycosyltransferase family 4 protein [Gemmatimonadaceae bacterium]|nr:glycosyltransferase family 4 protein [Gemmatimonadaceae bacterium]